MRGSLATLFWIGVIAVVLGSIFFGAEYLDIGTEEATVRDVMRNTAKFRGQSTFVLPDAKVVNPAAAGSSWPSLVFKIRSGGAEMPYIPCMDTGGRQPIAGKRSVKVRLVREDRCTCAFDYGVSYTNVTPEKCTDAPSYGDFSRAGSCRNGTTRETYVIQCEAIVQ